MNLSATRSIFLLLAVAFTSLYGTFAQDTNEESHAVERNVAFDNTISCPESTVERRNGPIRVAFTLPEGTVGGGWVEYNTGRAYRDIDGTCYSISWSNSAFVCDPDTGKYTQMSGSFQLANNVQKVLQPEDCVNGQGSIVNGVQEYLQVRNDMPTDCLATNITWNYESLHLRLSLPESMDTISFEEGYTTSFLNNFCHRLEWTNLTFSCDVLSKQWTRVTGNYTNTSTSADEVQGTCSSTKNNTNQEGMMAVDTSEATSCPALNVTEVNGPLSVEMNLPGNHSRGSYLTYQGGQVLRFVNEQCYTVAWTAHNFTCDIFSGQWQQLEGIFTIPPSTCQEGASVTIGGDQPFLNIKDTPTPVSTEAPSSAPSFGKVALGDGTEAPSSAPSFGKVALGDGTEAPSSAPSFGKSALGDGPETPSLAPSFSKVALGDGPEAPSPAPSSGRVALGDGPTFPPSSAPTGIYSVARTFAPTVRLTSPFDAPTNATDATIAPHVTATTLPPTTSSSPTMRPSYLRAPTPTPTSSSPTVSPLSTATPGSYCGCNSCTQEVWDTIASEFTCGQRITYVANGANTTITDACRLIGGAEFPEVCGACDPDSCLTRNNSTAALPDVVTVGPSNAPSASPTTSPIVTEETVLSAEPSTAPPNASFAVESDVVVDGQDEDEDDEDTVMTVASDETVQSDGESVNGTLIEEEQGEDGDGEDEDDRGVSNNEINLVTTSSAISTNVVATSMCLLLVVGVL